MNFTAFGPICLLRHPPSPSEVAHSATLLRSHYLTQRLEMNFTAYALSSLLSTILQLVIHIALIVSLLCSLKEGENQFYSTFSPIKWHTSDFSCFFPFNLFNKKKGAKINFWPLLPFYSPKPTPKERHTSSFCFCSAALSESLTIHQHTGGIFCLLLRHTSALYIAHVSTLNARQWRHCERAEGIKRSLKITGPSVATPPPTPPIDKAKSLVQG